MPKAAKKTTTKTAAKKGAKKTAPKRKSGYKKKHNIGEYASCTERTTIVPSSGGGYQTNTMYNYMSTALNQFTRAQLIASAYQHYRIKGIRITWKPTFDTFMTTTDPANVNTKHYLYYMIDKAGALPTNITFAGLKSMGARPRALDENPISTVWRPSVLTVDMIQGGVGAAVGQGAQYKVSPWLNTNANSVSPGAWVASSVDHLGIYWYVDQLAGNKQPYSVEIEVQFEFKKPLLGDAVGQFNAVGGQPAQRNASRDGYVDVLPGGDDQELVQ